MDMFLGTWGINAFATTLMAFTRTVIFRSSSDSTSDFFSFESLQWTQFLGFILTNLFLHQFLVQSVLSVNNIKINTSLKKSDFFGTLTWDGEDTRVMHLKDIPKYVSVKVGDTVITDGKSSIFPKGIMIGRVAGYDVDSKTGHWDISVELSQNMGQVQKVFVVKNLKKTELEEIKEILDAAVKEND